MQLLHSRLGEVELENLQDSQGGTKVENATQKIRKAFAAQFRTWKVKSGGGTLAARGGAVAE